MKKQNIVLVLTFLLVASLSFAQTGITWISVGIKAGYGTSFLFNSSSFDDPAVDYSLLSPTYVYGGKLAFSFNEGGVGVQLEYNNYSLSQKFSVDNGGNIVNHLANLNAISFGLILKTVSLSGFYFELGPHYNILKTANLDNVDIRNNFVDNYASAVLGFGIMPLFGDRLELSIGIRGLISLGSINANDNFSLYSSSPNYNNYLNNNLLSVMFVPMLDFSYVFAYMGKASCGRFRIMLNK